MKVTVKIEVNGVTLEVTPTEARELMRGLSNLFPTNTRESPNPGWKEIPYPPPWKPIPCSTDGIAGLAVSYCF